MLLTTDDGKLITRSPALREPAHVTLGAALGERELRAAVGAGTDEVLPFPGALAHHPFRPGGPYRRRRDRSTQRSEERRVGKECRSRGPAARQTDDAQERRRCSSH